LETRRGGSDGTESGRRVDARPRCRASPDGRPGCSFTLAARTGRSYSSRGSRLRVGHVDGAVGLDAPCCCGQPGRNGHREVPSAHPGVDGRAGCARPCRRARRQGPRVVGRGKPSSSVRSRPCSRTAVFASSTQRSSLRHDLMRVANLDEAEVAEPRGEPLGATRAMRSTFRASRSPARRSRIRQPGARRRS
jgi:hypothetical protein